MRRNMISWNVYGEDIDDRRRLDDYVSEAARLGFAGVQTQLREYTRPIDDPDVVAAMVYARDAAHRHGLQFWLHLDPRDALVSFFARYPDARQEVVVLVECPLEEGAFRLALDYSYLAKDHTQRSTHRFEAMDRVLAYRMEKRLQVADDLARSLFMENSYIEWDDRRRLLEVVDVESVVDLTASVGVSIDAVQKTVAGSGRWTAPSVGDWRVLGCFRLSMDTFDYASTEGADFQRALVDLYRGALGSDVDGLHSDERSVQDEARL